jgi:hypothetical protein
MKQVMQHPTFTADPLAAIKQHLQNTMAVRLPCFKSKTDFNRFGILSGSEPGRVNGLGDKCRKEE